jgi:hypothetical protein
VKAVRQLLGATRGADFVQLVASHLIGQSATESGGSISRRARSSDTDMQSARFLSLALAARLLLSRWDRPSVGFCHSRSDRWLRGSALDVAHPRLRRR